MLIPSNADTIVAESILAVMLLLVISRLLSFENVFAQLVLKILVDDLCQTNSCVQQLLLHHGQRVPNVDAGDVVAVAQAVVGGRRRVPLCKFLVGPSTSQQASESRRQCLVFNHEEQTASAVLMNGTIRP